MFLDRKSLEGRYVRLEPISPEIREIVRGALDCDPESWEIVSTNACGEGFETWWAQAMGESERGERIAYAIRRKTDDAVIGTSSFLNPRLLHRGIEIGATFLQPDARSGPYNPESKRLMLSHAFAADVIRVEMITDLRNVRSQAAIEKLGATREGVLRRHKVTWTGHVRDTVVYSITDQDWPGVRERLDFRLGEDFVV